MKALRTKDTKEWVYINQDITTSMAGYVLIPDSRNQVIRPVENDATRIVAELNTGHPCEWVNISIAVEGESVVVEVQEYDERPTYISWKATDISSNDYKHYESGWRDCMRHYGFLKEGGK